jgi:hypothetical protein
MPARDRRRSRLQLRAASSAVAQSPDRSAIHRLSVGYCRHPDNTVYAFAMLLAFATSSYNPSHARSKGEQNEARGIRGRARENMPRSAAYSA